MTTGTDHEVEFSVSYDGEALTQNTMDVRDLAPAKGFIATTIIPWLSYITEIQPSHF